MPTPMGKLLTLSVAFCAAAALCTAALLYRPIPIRAASGSTQSVTLPAPAAKSPEKPAPEPEPPTVYQLRSVDGELCVFRGKTLLHRTGVDVRTLPREDREMLERGISATSQEALASLLEDLSS